MDKMNEIIKIEGLRKRFGDNEVLKGITTSVRKGEVVAIIGPSGCGKSTFLRSINLLEEPTEGKIFIDDMDITSSDVDINRMRQRVGMVFHHHRHSLGSNIFHQLQHLAYHFRIESRSRLIKEDYLRIHR